MAIYRRKVSPLPTNDQVEAGVVSGMEVGATLGQVVDLGVSRDMRDTPTRAQILGAFL